MNVINELAVYAFLDEKIGFMEITDIIEKALNEIPVIDKPNIEDILNVEPMAREFFGNFIR